MNANIEIYCDDHNTCTWIPEDWKLEEIQEYVYELACQNPCYRYRAIHNQTGEIIADSDITANTAGKVFAESLGCSIFPSF